jgi:hypothetical protein
MTAEERERVRALVERTCAAQGVPLEVPPEAAQAVAAMIVGRPRRRYPPPASAGFEDGADRAPVAS